MICAAGESEDVLFLNSLDNIQIAEDSFYAALLIDHIEL